MNPKEILWSQWKSLGSLMEIYEDPMEVLWKSWGTLMETYGNPKETLWKSYRHPMEILWRS